MYLFTYIYISFYIIYNNVDTFIALSDRQQKQVPSQNALEEHRIWMRTVEQIFKRHRETARSVPMVPVEAGLMLGNSAVAQALRLVSGCF